jgi:hypothetical protein
MVLTQSTHPLEVTVATDSAFTNVLVSDSDNQIVDLTYEGSGFSCTSEPVTIYIKAVDEEHDSTQLTIQDPVFQLCGAELIDPSLVLLNSLEKAKADVAGDLRHDINGGSHVHVKVWQYTFAVKKTNDKKANYQLSIKVTEGNEGQDTSTTPFSAMRLLSLNFPPQHDNIQPYTNQLETIIFNITNPNNLYLEVPQQIEEAVRAVTFSDILGINSTQYGNCKNCLNDYVIEVQVVKEIYPYFFSEDCDKFMFNYKRTETMDYERLNNFDSNLITTDIGVNVLTYRVVCKETGEPIKDTNEDVITKTIVFQFNPVIHIKETNVTIPEGEAVYDGSSNLVARKGDILEYFYDTSNATVSSTKENESYRQNYTVLVWEQGAKPADTTTNDVAKSLNPLTVKKYVQENKLVNISVSAWDLQLNQANNCYDLSQCGNEYTLNYEDYKANTYNDNDDNNGVDCDNAPVYKLQLTLNTELNATHIWDSSECEYRPSTQDDITTVEPSLLNNHSFNVNERYVLFRQNRVAKDIRLRYGSTPQYDINNSLTIDDLTTNEQSRSIEVLYQSDALPDGPRQATELPFLTSMKLLQSLTKYPEGSVQRTLTTIQLNTNIVNRPYLIINNAYPHEFLVKLSIIEAMESICDLSGCPTIANGVYGTRTEEEMFRIELGYLNANVNPTLKFNRANVLGATENDEITKIDIVRNPSNPSQNYIDPMTIQNLFYQGNKNAHINKRLIGVRYSDPVMGEYLHDDDFFQNSVYVDEVRMITGKIGKYDANGNVITRYDANGDVITPSVSSRIILLSNGDNHNKSSNNAPDNRILLKDYLLTMDKFPNQCIPNDLLGFDIDLRFDSLAIDAHSGSNGTSSLSQSFIFYHVNDCYRSHLPSFNIRENALPVTIEFKVDQLQFTDHKEQLLTKALRHNPNYRNTGVGGDGLVDGINAENIFDLTLPEYAQIDTLYVAPRVPEGDGYVSNTWINTVVQHDNGMDKALYESGLVQSFITNYGNEFTINQTARGLSATNRSNTMSGNYGGNIGPHPSVARNLLREEYVFNNTDCFQLTNDDNRVMVFDLDRSAQDVLFRHELGDTTDPVRYEQVRNATLEMQHSIKYVDYQGFSHPRYPPAKADEVVEDEVDNKVIQINGVLDPSCDEEARYALHKTFKWNLELDIIKNPTLVMDSMEVTLMDDADAKLCRPFWMKGQEFAEWLKHAYERKVEQDVLEVEVEPTNAELHENEAGNPAPAGGANNGTQALDDPNYPPKHMYIDNQGEFHHQFGEKVWIESAVYTPNQPGHSDDEVTLYGIGNNNVGMVARNTIVSDVSLCEQEAPEFSGLEQCVDVAKNDTLLNGLRNDNLDLSALFGNLEVKYWNAEQYWASNDYVEGVVGESNDFHDPNDVEGDKPGLVDDTNNDGPVDFDELTKNPREEVYTTDQTFSIDFSSNNFGFVFKPSTTAIGYADYTGNQSLPYEALKLMLSTISNEQISVIEIPLIKQDAPEEGYVSKTTRVVLKVSVQDTTSPVVSLVDSGDYTVDRLASTNAKWLSSQIVVEHPRYVFEFAHLVEEGYVWDKFEDNNCIAIRDMLAPKVLAYQASALQLGTSVLTRRNPNSLQLTSGLTGVVPSNCANCYQETHVTSLEYISTRKDSQNVDAPNNVDNDDTHDSIFNGDVFEGTLTISGYNGQNLNLPYDQVQDTYVSVVTNDTHNSDYIVGDGVVGEYDGEVVMLQQGEELWNRMGLTQQDKLVVATYQKQLAQRFTSVNVFERDVDLSYPSCGTLKVTARVVLPSAMLEQCPVTTQTITPLPFTLPFKSVFNGLLLDINNDCGLINKDVSTELPLDVRNVNAYEHVTEDCIGTLTAQGEIDPVIFARARGSLACSLEFNVASSSGCLFERYTEYDETIATRETCTDLGGNLSIATLNQGVPAGAGAVDENVTDKVFNIMEAVNGAPVNLKLGGASSAKTTAAEIITLDVAAVDAELYCEPRCESIFTGALDNQVCANTSTHNITLTEKSVPTLLFKDAAAAAKSYIELTGTPDVNGHFTDALWGADLEAAWDIPEQLKQDADGNANLRVLVREITVDGVNHYNGDIKGVHLIYNDCQEISDVITRSNNLTQESDLVDLVNNELEAGNAASLQINAYSGEEIKVTYQAIGFLGKYLVNSDIKTINYTIQ